MKKSIFFSTVLFVLSFTINAQNDTIYVMKHGAIVGKYNVNTEVDSIIFYQPQTAEGNTFIDSRDGTLYKTVVIGNQEWMAENLKYLPSVSSLSTFYSTPNYYVYGYDGTNVLDAKATSNYNTYGVLYNWPAAMDGEESSSANPSGVQGVCPVGWHLPSDAEWKQLTDYLGGLGFGGAGGKLKESGTAHWSNSNTGVTNESGFTALPGGYSSDTFYALGGGGYWWSATELPPHYAGYMFLNDGLNNVQLDISHKASGYSVRCVKGSSGNGSLPTITTNPISEITQTSAIAGGNITNTGGAEVTESGIVFSTAQNPTINMNHGITTDGLGIGNFASFLTGLTPETTYYVRAYATNILGIAYGEQVVFTTLAEQVNNIFTDSRDGNIYKTISIGNQLWMAENLKYLPNVSGPGTGSNTDSYYYVYGYDGANVSDAKSTSNYTTYGVLYNWSAAMNGSLSSIANPSGVQGVCPSGWHLPSDAEWTELTDYLGGDLIAGGKLKETGTAHWISLSTGTTNETDFTALPGGFRRSSGNFSGIGSYGYFWNSTEANNVAAWLRGLGYGSSDIGKSTNYKEFGFSVRCLKNSAINADSLIIITIPIDQITTTTATAGGNITNTGGAEVIESGIVYSTTQTPTIDMNQGIITDDIGIGMFASVLTGLTPETTYYVRAYATNILGTAYGEQVSFTTLTGQADTIFTDYRDGNEYKTVTIGNQVWMAENLKYLPSVTGPVTSSKTAPYYYVYDYNGTNANSAKATSNYTTYGVLYNWPAAMNGFSGSSSNPSGVQGVCPSGWHLPSEAEWTQLTDYLGGRNKALPKLKEAGTNHWEMHDPVDETINESGFTALPGGGYFESQIFFWIRNYGYWWTATEGDTNLAYYFSLGDAAPEVEIFQDNKSSGFSVRCIKD